VSTPGESGVAEGLAESTLTAQFRQPQHEPTHQLDGIAPKECYFGLGQFVNGVLIG
jgi:hypothetical protein